MIFSATRLTTWDVLTSYTKAWLEEALHEYIDGPLVDSDRALLENGETLTTTRSRCQHQIHHNMMSRPTLENTRLNGHHSIESLHEGQTQAEEVEVVSSEYVMAN